MPPYSLQPCYSLVCDHLGVFSFDSSEYEISEGSGSIRINAPEKRL